MFGVSPRKEVNNLLNDEAIYLEDEDNKVSVDESNGLI